MNAFKYYILLITLFLTLMSILKQGLRINFSGELILFVIFFIISLKIIIEIFNHKESGIFNSIFFLVSILNLFYIKSGFRDNPDINAGTLGYILFGFALFLNSIAFLISITSIGSKDQDEDMSLLKPAKEKKEAPVKAAKEEKSVSKSFVPGKFVASKSGSVYHAPKCEWAKKIAKKNRVWYNDKNQAKKNGLKQHSCIK